MKKEEKDCTFGFHNPYFTAINHLHMHVLSGKRGGLRYFFEFGNNFIFKEYSKVYDSLKGKIF